MKTINAKKRLTDSPQISITIIGYHSKLTNYTYKRKSSRKIAEFRTQLRNERKKSHLLKIALLKAVSLENAIYRAKQNLKELGYSFKRYTNRIKAQMALRKYRYQLSTSLRTLLF